MKKAINRRNMRLLLILIFSIICFSFCLESSNIKKTFALVPDITNVSVQTKTVHRGQTFSVDIDIAQNEGLTSLMLTLDYDNTVMVLKDVIKGEALTSLTITTTNVETPQGYGILPFNILWDGREQDASNGTIITLIFDSFMEAPIGEYPINVTYDRQNTNGEYKTPIDVAINDGYVNLIAGEFQAIYKDYDGRVLFQKDYNDNDIPSYPTDLPNPSREADSEYSYEFVGWKGAVSDEINTLIFEADYKLTPKVYTVFYYVDGANGYPDGIIDKVEDYYDKVEYAFGSVIEAPEIPHKAHYQFWGWYEDESFQTPSRFALMPAKSIDFYGYYTFEVRETNVPVISLEKVSVDENLEDVVITAEILRNTGFNGLVLTLDYDDTALTFEGFENLNLFGEAIQFDSTNPSNLSVKNFKFYYEGATNTYQTGEFLKLNFKIKSTAPGKTYIVKFDYDYFTDATYINNSGELKYTKIEFYNAEIPVGKIRHWTKELGSDRKIDVTSAEDKPINVRLEVELITESIQLDADLIKKQVGKRMYVSSVYEISLMQNRKKIEPNTTLTIKIKLTENEQKGKTKLYYLNDDNELESYDFEIVDGELIFTTNHLSSWVIFNNYVEKDYSGNVFFNIALPIVLAIATMFYAFRLKQKITIIKKKGAHND